ncbi:MAG TPA: FHA domain-containing protein [Nannocystis sp.]|jgi:S-DNA-T family DNA segregation ATPase FtsK/SpoIIIE
MTDLTIAVREQTGIDAGRVHHLRLGRHVIGRDPSASIQLRSTDVSRQHAILEVSPEAVTVTDLGSKNGVLLKRKHGKTAITGPTLLADGAIVEVGGVDLLVAHPGAQVDRALARVGEATITRIEGSGAAAGAGPGPLVPLLLTATFAAVVAALLWLG